jgi:hypothetical protein
VTYAVFPIEQDGGLTVASNLAAENDTQLHGVLAAGLTLSGALLAASVIAAQSAVTVSAAAALTTAIKLEGETISVSLGLDLHAGELLHAATAGALALTGSLTTQIALGGAVQLQTLLQVTEFHAPALVRGRVRIAAVEQMGVALVAENQALRVVEEVQRIRVTV